MTATVFHGGGLDAAVARHGGRRQDWLDLSTGINPVPYPLPAIAAEAWARLPDSGAEHRPIEAARATYGVPDHLAVLAAPGTQALIGALPRLLAGDTATIVAPATGTYGEHAHCCAAAGRRLRQVRSPDAVADDESLAILVHPNNPDGHVWQPTALAALAARLASRGGTLLVDEAFCDVCPEASIVSAGLAGTIVLRSFGKFFGLAGLRLGFAIAAPDLVARLAHWFGPWAVSGPALAVGTAALGDAAWIAATRRRLESDSLSLASLLEGHGFSVAGRTGLFVLAGHRRAAAIAQALARHHILVRPFPDRPQLIRFGLCASADELARLERALSAVASEPA
ncbi:MAG: threonine-phosphate decarboxylase [Alphaproteobacteria bacterium]|nr:MAG: threonine-phosphate decarboxylase [Alphaproteobacteria bacterium]